MFQKSIITATCVAMLAGCAAIDRAEQTAKVNTRSTETKMQALANSAAAPTVASTPTPYLLGTKIAVGRRDPAWLTQEVHLASARPLTLDQAALQITQMTGVPVIVQTSASEYARTKNSGGQGGAMSLPGVAGSPSLVLPPLPGAGSNKGAELVLNWDGPLRGLLDSLAAQAGVFWKYENGEVRFFLTETRVFELSALPGISAMSSTITNAGSAGGGGTSGQSASQSGTTQQNASSTINIDHYKAIESAVKTVLQQAGAGSASKFSSVSLDPASGQLIVTATPPELDAVERYVLTINNQMARNVLVDVNIYAVEVSESAQVGFNLTAALAAAKGDLKALTFSGATAPNPVAGAVSASIAGSDLNISAFLDALQKYGRTSLVTRGTVIALNGQPTPLQVAKSQGYLASSTTTIVPNSGTVTTLTPGTVVSGFSGTFLPLIRGDRILLEYSLNITQNLGLDSVSSGGSTIQTPNTASQSLVQRASLKSGDTIILSGFEQMADAVSGADGIAMTSKSGQRGKNVLVITMRVANLGG